MSHQLSAVAEELCQEAAEVSLAWFGAMNERVVEYTLPDGYAEPGGEASVAIGAWFMMNSLQYAKEESSLNTGEQSIFAQEMSALLFGSMAQDGWQMIGEWAGLEAGQAVFNFAAKVAKHITGDTHPLEATMEIANCIPVLTEANLKLAEAIFTKHRLKRKKWGIF
jgi:hypothetical protein